MLGTRRRIPSHGTLRIGDTLTEKEPPAVDERPRARGDRPLPFDGVATRRQDEYNVEVLLAAVRDGAVG